MHAASPYIDEVRRNLPRLLSLIDADPSSASHGIGDRFYWAWGLIDFPNGTFQGSAHGLARLWKNGLWPFGTPPETFVTRLDAIFRGAECATRKDGSLEEAFPNEGSYCVTALVAFDLLQAIDLMGPDGITPPTRKEWLRIVEPMIAYLLEADETHAVISNHLATAVAALVRWHKETDDTSAESRARVLLDRILDHQSDEGWFEEYGGADPGYESLCLHYLADVHRLRPDWELLEALARSVRFVWHFAHPDGSFGGLYGSRCTRFYYPSGFLALSSEIPEAGALAAFMAESIEKQCVVTLSAIDEPNLIPMFNSYCWAAELSMARSADTKSDPVPAIHREQARLSFPDAGLLIDSGEQHYTIVSTHKGGVISHFDASGNAVHNAGIVARNPSGVFGSTQSHTRDNPVDLSDNTLSVGARFCAMPRRLPGPWSFLALRILCVSVFRWRPLREWVKRRLARMLITESKAWPASNRRTIRLGADLEVVDEPSMPDGYEIRDAGPSFVAIHMASQGYWQVQDEIRKS